MADNKCTVVKFKGYLKFIDLGLPSGTKWAAYNIGATSPYEAGDYFSWGNVDGHNGDGYSFSQAVYDETTGATLTGDIPVNAAYDAARANFGNKAKLPTKEQFAELDTNCTSEWTTVNGVNGRRLTSNINGNSIFLPASGYYDGLSLGSSGSLGFYWSSSFYSETRAYYLYLNSSTILPSEKNDRRFGFTVRAVM